MTSRLKKYSRSWDGKILVAPKTPLTRLNVKNKAMDFVEDLSRESLLNKKSLFFSEDNLVKWLVDFSLQHSCL